jgi:hypothetical protein
MPSLHRCLVDYDMGHLRALAQARGVSLDTNRQTEAADYLADVLSDAVSVADAVEQLSSPAQEALGVLAAAGGRMRRSRFARRFGQVRPFGPGRLERETPWQAPASPAEELWLLGLTFHVFDTDEAGAGEFVIIPDELLPWLSPAEFQVPAFDVPHAPEPDQVRSGGQPLVHDLFVLLVFAQNHELVLVPDGVLDHAAREGLNRRLAVREPLSAQEGPGGRPEGEKGLESSRLDWLHRRAERMGLVEVERGRLRPARTEARAWLSVSEGEALRRVQDAWRDDPTWNDLAWVPDLIWEDRGAAHDPVLARGAVLRWLARCPIGAWLQVAGFVAAVKSIDPDFERPDADYTTWYVRDRLTDEYLSGFESWDVVEGRLLRALLVGPLCWLGVVDTSQAGDAFCLTELGGQWLGLLPAKDEAVPSPPVIVHPDFSVEVPVPPSLYVRFQLERFARPEREDQVCRYRLVASALGRIMAQGVRVEQVIAFLQQASTPPGGETRSLPAHVVGQLRQWAGRWGRVELEQVTLVRAQDERALRELMALPETRHLIQQTLSPTLAVVRKRDRPRLERELRELGYLAEEL